MAPALPAVYPLQVVAKKAGPVMTMTGIAVAATQRMDRIDDGVDTLIVAGGDGIDAARRDARTLAWLKRMSRRVRRLVSVCNGALLLAEAGLLDGRRATTHWSDTAELARAFPKVVVEPDRIYTRDGNVYTSGGVTAGMDLALRLVEEDFGAEIALLVAKRLVLFLRRPGARRVGGDEPAQLRAHVRAADRHDARQVRRARSRRGGTRQARADGAPARCDRTRLRLQPRGTHAASLPPIAFGGPFELSGPIQRAGRVKKHAHNETTPRRIV